MKGYDNKDNQNKDRVILYIVQYVHLVLNFSTAEKIENLHKNKNIKTKCKMSRWGKFLKMIRK